MKSPQELAARLVQQWSSADWRERQLLGGSGAWPLILPIGQTGTQVFMNDAALLRSHLQQWRNVEQQGLGIVKWQERSYRGSNDAIAVPTHWQLNRPSEWLAAIQQLRPAGHAQVKVEYSRLCAIIAAVEHPGFQRLLARRLTQWQNVSVDDVKTAARLAMQLEPGCALGRPLRALAVDGNDSKFYERHTGLLTALLDERFAKEASRQGLSTFLGALVEDDHWLLVVPLAPDLLPFARLRVSASELRTTALPSRRILLVENEQCLHQLPMPMDDTIAILGAGLNLNWLDAPWLKERSVAYWGDIDTWGLLMLETARKQLSQLQALLMDMDTFREYQGQAVTEPVHACSASFSQSADAALDAHLRNLEKGRLEQEFLPASRVHKAVNDWASSTF